MNKPKNDNFLYRHFKRNCHTPANILVQPVEKITYDANSTSRFKIIKNYEVPIICYEYNKPIRGAIFNFNKLGSDLDIETCTPDS